MMRPSVVRFLAVAVLFIAALTLAGCGGGDGPESGKPVAGDTPAVCSSVDALEKSVDEVKNVNLDRDALPTLKTSLSKVQSALSQVKSDAKDEYATEVSAVDQAASSVSSSLQSAGASPSAKSLANVATAVQSLGASVTTLQDSVKSTC